jgi:hypothetical protein
MAKIKGMCRNEDCEMCDQIQEAEKSNFKCEKCGKDLIPFGNKISEPGGGPNKKLIAIIAGVVVLLAIIGGVIALGGSGEEAPKQEPVTVAPVDSDSIKAAQMAAENQKLKDSLAAAEAAKQKAEEDAKKKPEEVKKPQPPTGGGSKNLGYATFKGSWPNDVNGRMVFKTSHVIDSKDPKGRVAEAGDYVIGEWADGHLVQGIWYGADNQVKGSVIIGR